LRKSQQSPGTPEVQCGQDECASRLDFFDVFVHMRDTDTDHNQISMSYDLSNRRRKECNF